MPTEASGVQSASAAATDPAVARLPIIRIPPRRTGGATATPTVPGAPTATPAPSSTAAPSATPASTNPPGPTATRTPTSPPTATATPAGPIAIRLRGISWQWDFYGPAGNGGSTVTLKRGQAYRIEFFNDGVDQGDGVFHTFSGISALGLNALSLAPGDSVFVNLTPNQTGTFPFACTNSSCGIGHDNMTGTLKVVP